MSEYARLKQEKAELNDKIKLARRRENERLRERYPGWFKALDILLVVAFLANLGAYLSTKVLVTMTQPDKQVVEANPVTAESQDLPTSEEANKGFWRFLLHFTLLAGLIAFMFYQRSFMVSYWGLWCYTGIVLFFSGLLILDFLSNVAMLSGVLLR